MRRRIFVGLGLAVFGLGSWLGLTNNSRIWPVRNTLQYHVMQRWDEWFGRPSGVPITIRGMVRSTTGQPIAQARVLVAAHDGTPYSAESDQNGNFVLEAVPAGSYVPVAAAAGYQPQAVRQLGAMRVALDGSQPLVITLTPRPDVRPAIAPASNFRLSEPQAVEIANPIPATAISRTVSYGVNGRPNQETLYYTPNDGQASLLPVLLAVYPGPASTWDTVSLPMAQAGYAVIAVGPAYALDLEPDVDDFERLLEAVHAGQFPRADANRLGILGGSYSGLHLFRLLQRTQQPIRAALFLGPPTDMFEMRREFVVDGRVPPFGLDQALIALGFPDRNPEPYWRYSVRYHARELKPVPLMIIHSKVDEVVPFTQSQLLADELNRLGIAHELHILEGMGHYLLAETRTPAVDDLYTLTLGFFAEHLR